MNEDSECPNVAVLIVPLCIQSKTMSWWILGTRVEMVMRWENRYFTPPIMVIRREFQCHIWFLMSITCPEADQ